MGQNEIERVIILDICHIPLLQCFCNSKKAFKLIGVEAPHARPLTPAEDLRKSLTNKKPPRTDKGIVPSTVLC